MAQMLWCLFLLEAKFDLTLPAAHMPGFENGPADSLSSFHRHRPAGSQGTSDPFAGKRNLDLRYLEQVARDLANNSVAPSTKGAYASGWKRYLEFCWLFLCAPIH